MEGHPRTEGDQGQAAFSPVIGDPLYRVQRLLGLVSTGRLNVGRRAVLYAALCWLPLMVWYALHGSSAPSLPDESLLRHYGVHIRCLITIPLLVIAEAFAERVFGRVIPHLEATGIVPAALRDRFREVLSRATRLRDSWVAWLVILAFAGLAAWSRLPALATEDALSWSEAGSGSFPGFGYVWYSSLVVPLSVVLLLAWFWRLAVVAVLFHRIGRLDLELVPTHPDHMGGLGFLEWVPTAFSPVIFAMTSVVAGGTGHLVLYHGVSLGSLKAQAVVLVVVLLLIFLSPLLALGGPLRRLKRRGEFEYTALAGRMGGMIDRKWIRKEPVNDPVLDAPEIGPMVDLSSIYLVASNVRLFPIGKRALGAVLVPSLIPMLCVVLLKVPIAEILLRLAKALG